MCIGGPQRLRAKLSKAATRTTLGRPGRRSAAYIEAVPQQPAVPVRRLALLLVPPSDDVRDAHRQRVRGPPESQGRGAGVDHHDEVALDLLQAQNASGGRPPRGAALPSPAGPLKGAARPHLLQGLGHGGGDDGPLAAALLSLTLLVLAVLRLAFLRLGHFPGPPGASELGPAAARGGTGGSTGGTAPWTARLVPRGGRGSSFSTSSRRKPTCS